MCFVKVRGQKAQELGAREEVSFGKPFVVPLPLQCACSMLGMAQKKQNYIIWKVPVTLKAMKDLSGSFCKAIQKRYFGIAITSRLE